MILHIASIIGCSIMAIAFIVLYAVTHDQAAIWFALGSALLGFCVYLNILRELKNSEEYDDQDMDKMEKRG